MVGELREEGRCQLLISSTNIFQECFSLLCLKMEAKQVDKNSQFSKTQNQSRKVEEF